MTKKLKKELDIKMTNKGGDEMTNEEKSIIVAGTMFLTLATALFITGMFFMKALGTALLIALATYVFFDTCYYVKKD